MHPRPRSSRRSFLILTLAGLGGAGALSSEAGAQWVVTDPGHTAQTVLLLAQQLDSYRLQMQQYQNMMQNTIRLPTSVWGNVMNDIMNVRSIVEQGRHVAANLGMLDRNFSQAYPGYGQYLQRDINVVSLQPRFNEWSEQSRDNSRAALRGAGLQLDQMDNDDALRREIAALSQNADGQVRAVQAGTMMTSQAVQDMQKLRQLQALQIQMQANYIAEQSDRQSVQDAGTNRLLQVDDLPERGGTRY